MCGISGYVCLNEPGSIQTNVLKRMTDVISHRGPDGEGFWINDTAEVGFGHRRLSIIDLSVGGKQPMHYLNNRYTITFNGEIYNYIELREQLSNKGYVFTSQSDTEVLLALYDDRKENCLSELEGMFAFAIWDSKEQILFCARDRFGEKPFHYYSDEKKFIFGSEIKQLWAAGIEKIVDERRLHLFIKEGIIDDPNDLTSTFYKNIKKLDAAHYLVLARSGSIKIKKYWEIDKNAPKFTGTIDQAAQVFLEHFTNSIQLRLRSDVPVGSSLSGGIDSSAIVMLIDQLKGKETKQNTFSARFKDFEKDEGKHIEEVIKNCRNVEAHYTWPDQEYFNSVIDQVIYFQDEPFGSASIIAQYAVMELAKQNNVTVLLDGQGADEQLAGYLPYYSLYLDALSQTNKLKFNTELEQYQKLHGLVKPYKSVLQKETLRMKLGRWRRNVSGQSNYFENSLNSRLMNDTCIHGLKELLRYADRNSMAHSREVRLPFLSHQLVEFVFSLPDEFKLNKGWTKFVMRKAMDPVLPKSICWRVDKVGYEPPQKNWLLSESASRKISLTKKVFLNAKEENIPEWRLFLASSYIK